MVHAHQHCFSGYGQLVYHLTCVHWLLVFLCLPDNAIFSIASAVTMGFSSIICYWKNHSKNAYEHHHTCASVPSQFHITSQHLRMLYKPYDIQNSLSPLLMNTRAIQWSTRVRWEQKCSKKVSEQLEPSLIRLYKQSKYNLSQSQSPVLTIRT